jgi:ParB-like chromosome segregation protein Spo0J
MPCIIVDYDDKEAKIKTLQLNYMRGSAVPIRLAHLIYDLNKEIKLEDLARRLPYDEPQLMDNLELLKLPEGLDKTLEAQALKEEEEMPTVLSFVLYRRQLEVVEEAISKAVQALPNDTKNLRAMALEKICAQYLEQQGLKNKLEMAAETG